MSGIEYGPIYQDGHILVENQEVIDRMDFAACSFGVQVANDGRVWVCVNGVAWLRFKPDEPPA